MRNVSEVIADLTAARKSYDEAKTDKDRAPIQERIETLQDEVKEVREAVYQAEYSSLMTQIGAVDGEESDPAKAAGKKAALRRRANGLRREMGLPDQYTGSGPAKANTTETAKAQIKALNELLAA